MTAREALLKIQTVFEINENYLMNGGLELSETELNYIKDTLVNGLEDNNAQN